MIRPVKGKGPHCISWSDEKKRNMLDPHDGSDEGKRSKLHLHDESSKTYGLIWTFTMVLCRERSNLHLHNGSSKVGKVQVVPP